MHSECVPQGSVLRPQMFNVNVNDLLMYLANSQVYNYTGDSILYAIERNITQTVETSEKYVIIMEKWFQSSFSVI